MGLFDPIKNMFSSSSELQDYWHVLQDATQISLLIEKSHEQPQMIYKHSHRCATCFFAQKQIEKVADQIRKKAGLYFVDVIGSRTVSDQLAERLQVRHESPQLLLVDQGKVIWHTSHGQIQG